jgi:hypothetical protein
MPKPHILSLFFVTYQYSICVACSGSLSNIHINTAIMNYVLIIVQESFGAVCEKLMFCLSVVSVLPIWLYNLSVIS